MTKINLNIPTSWDELSQQQYLKITKLLSTGKKGLLFDYRCFLILVNCRFYQLLKLAKMHYILSQIPLRTKKNAIPNQINCLTDAFQFIYLRTNRTKFPKIKPIKGVQLHPPLEKMTNISMYEFSIADDMHIKFNETKNIEYLRYLAASLYAEQLQPRPLFDKNNLELLKPRFQKTPLKMLLAIDMAFAGSVEYMAKRFTHAFPKPKTKENVPTLRKNKNSGWPEVILKMAGGKFGNHEQTKHTNCYTFLAEFNENLKNPPKNG
jgi:hypothetical protein